MTAGAAAQGGFVLDARLPLGGDGRLRSASSSPTTSRWSGPASACSSDENDIEVVAEAGNGREAVDKAARFDPNVVLMDIRMPELDGLEATRRILAGGSGGARPRAHHLRPRRVRLRGAPRGRERVRPEGRSAGAADRGRRTVASGDALLSPAITKRVINEFARMPRPAPPKELDDLSGREREVFRLIALGLSNAQDRTGALHRRDDREDARHPHPLQARPARPRPGGRPRVPDRRLRSGRASARRGA